MGLFVEEAILAEGQSTKDRVNSRRNPGGYFGLAGLVLASRDPLSSNALLLASVFLLVEKN